MSSLKILDKPLVGGIESLEFVPVEGLDAFPEDNLLSVEPSGLTLKNGYEWIDVPAVAGSLLFSEQQQLSAQGVRYQKEARGFLPHDDLENRTLLQQYLFAKLVLRYKDHTGNWKLSGSPQEPFRMVCNFETAEFAGQIGYRLSFTGRHGSFSRYIINGSLGTININAAGKLVISPELQGVISLSADGKLVANGPDANRYSLNANGELVYT